MSTHLFARFLRILGAGAVALSLIACDSVQPSQEQGPTPSAELAPEGGSGVQEEGNAADATEDSAGYTLSEDPVVDAFAVAYNELSPSPFAELEKGNISTKYHGVSDGYYFELLHANDTDKIHVSISQTNETASRGVAGMREAFCNAVMAIDQTVDAQTAGTFFDSMLAGGVLVEGSALGNTSVTFVPDKELSGGYSRGHVEISESA